MMSDTSTLPAIAEKAALLELRDITKSYGHIRALSQVNFTIRQGEAIGLLGDNGAGKSTLIKIMSGVVTPDSGKLSWHGEVVTLRSRRDSERLGIETIYQDGALCDSMPIWRNIFLGRELRGLLGFMHIQRMRETSIEVLRSLTEMSQVHSPDTWVGDLSGGQRQAVAIARAVFFKRTLLLLDEPTSALGVRETEAVLAYIERLKSENVSSVLITHNVHHAYQVCDRFVVMSRGRVRNDMLKTDISQDALIRLVAEA
jgi:simple sugar transport system ATP-binding protein